MSQQRRAKKTTLHQFGVMLDYFENHPEMITGKISDKFSGQMREKLWTDLSVLLNSVTSGPQKTPQKWRKTWIDIKSEAKQRDRESKEHSKLRGNSNPPPLPLHLARIMSLVRLSNAFSDQTVKENNSADQSCIIKECFTEEASPETEMLCNGNLELNGEQSPVIKMENLSDILSTSESECFEKVYNIPSTSADNVLDNSNTVQSPCRNVSEIPSTSEYIPTEKNSEISSICTITASKNDYDHSSTPSEISKENNSSSISKNSCEKVCDILTTSVKKLNDVIKNSENRTITAFNALTKATVKANDLRERQLQIEEERNRLYQERNEILFTLVNTFLEKKVNQH